MTHEEREARRVEGWIVLPDCTLPISPDMALEEIHSQYRGCCTSVSYADGRTFETVVSRRAIFRAMLGNDDAVTFEAKIGIPRDLPTKE